MNNEYLIHYGVLGMKWGVRKDPQRAYSKARKKLSKIQNKAFKLQAKAKKKKDRLYLVPHDPEVISRRLHKIKMMEVRASHYTKKGEKWLREMDKVFSTVPLP